MEESPVPVTHYRCTCPHCEKVLKIRIAWAGRKGICPHCSEKVAFPPFKASSASATTQQLLKLVAEEDNALFDDARFERLALLLSEATCHDYELADKLLDARPLSPRQWRRALNAADLRESMRLRMAEALTDDPAPRSTGEEPVALQVASDILTPHAWKILARFIYFKRHGICDACRANPTGLACMYLTFDTFTIARSISAARSESWQRMLHRFLGL